VPSSREAERFLRGTPWEPSVIKNSSLAILLFGLVLFVERAFL
jgi:hypothetical protein